MSLINFMCFSLVVFINNFVPPANLPFIKLTCHILCSFAVKIFILSRLKEEENDEIRVWLRFLCCLFCIQLQAAGGDRSRDGPYLVSKISHARNRYLGLCFFVVLSHYLLMWMSLSSAEAMEWVNLLLKSICGSAFVCVCVGWVFVTYICCHIMFMWLRVKVCGI